MIFTMLLHRFVGTIMWCAGCMETTMIHLQQHKQKVFIHCLSRWNIIRTRFETCILVGCTLFRHCWLHWWFIKFSPNGFTRRWRNKNGYFSFFSKCVCDFLTKNIYSFSSLTSLVHRTSYLLKWTQHFAPFFPNYQPFIKWYMRFSSTNELFCWVVMFSLVDE